MARVIAEEALLLGDPDENKNSLYVGYLEEKKKNHKCPTRNALSRQGLRLLASRYASMLNGG